MANSYPDDYPPPPRQRGERAPLPANHSYQDDSYGSESRGRRAPPSGPTDNSQLPPPPPIGETLQPKPALRREGSRSRLPPDATPQFPDEASYLGSNAPDLERKNRPKDRAFRERRDGYESDEGEAHRRKMSGRRPRDEDDPRGPPPRQRDRDRDGNRDGNRDRDRDRDRDRPSYLQDDSQVSRRRPDPYDDGQSSRRIRREPQYDDEDDEPPPRRRRDKDRPSEGVEYGSDPVPARRRSERRPRRGDDYDDDDDNTTAPPSRRRRSLEDSRQAPPRRGDSYADDRDGRRRRDRDDRGDGRGDRSRRYNDDYDDEYDRRDRRDRSRDNRRRDRDEPPQEMKIGGVDVGGLLAQGKQHWGTVGPIVTPLVLNYARKHFLGGSGGGGGGSGRR